jgi:hypothetical protein
MSNQQENELIRELAEIGDNGDVVDGTVGSSLGGFVAGGAGGAAGARFAKRFLPTGQYQQQVSVSRDVKTTFARLATR